MKGDIFNNSYSYAKGDIFYALGDMTETCTLNKPYTDQRIQSLRDAVSVASNTSAEADATRDQAKKDWQNCKGKLFGFISCGAKNNRLDQTEAQQQIAAKALDAANADLKQAQDANDQAQSDYNTCFSQQLSLAKLAPAVVNSTTGATPTPSTTSVAAAIDSPYAKYGLIGVVVVIIGLVGYKFLKH
jgi:hypothetical protein